MYVSPASFVGICYDFTLVQDNRFRLIYFNIAASSVPAVNFGYDFTVGDMNPVPDMDIYFPACRICGLCGYGTAGFQGDGVSLSC
ncbi:MAG: hypothetical protein GY820_37025 [Gammaproteobacteria bacterium]|nr:hypothetical protein [Gammaproteobacteria bacterium]